MRVNSALRATGSIRAMARVGAVSLHQSQVTASASPTTRATAARIPRRRAPRPVTFTGLAWPWLITGSGSTARARSAGCLAPAHRVRPDAAGERDLAGLEHRRTRWHAAAEVAGCNPAA